MARRKHLIQIVNDNRSSQQVLKAMLEPAGFRVVTCATCVDGERAAASQPPDLMVLGWGLADHGLGLIRAIRTWSSVPILMLSARRAEARRLAAFEAGVDDYILEPCSAPELLARVRAALRFHARGGWLPSGVLEFDNLSIDLGRRVACHRDGRTLELTRLEYRVLETLVRGCNRVVSHARIMTAVWGPNSIKSLELRLCVSGLRKKLEVDPSRPSRIITELGVGYRLVTHMRQHQLA